MTKRGTLFAAGLLLVGVVVFRVYGLSEKPHNVAGDAISAETRADSGGDSEVDSGAEINEQVIAVAAEVIPLDPKNPAMVNTGKARYVGGWALKSPSKSFGGYSGLMIAPAQNRLLAISDKGEWWQAAFNPMAMLPPQQNRILSYTENIRDVSKIDLDAESIVAHKGGVLVSFEQRHRIEWTPEPGRVAVAAGFMKSASFAGVSNNGGMEAITIVDGKLLAFAERGLDQAGRLKAWLASDDGLVETLFFAPPRNYAPTDAATMPNGDVLVLLRQYSAIDGVAIKVHHIKRADVQAGAVLKGEEVLHLTPKMSVDNMEGLDVVAVDRNTVRLVMIADDNFSALQRTLLMMFDYTYRSDN